MSRAFFPGRFRYHPSCAVVGTPRFLAGMNTDPMRVFDDWFLTPHRLAVHEPTGTAVIADLHLGYSQARRARGDAVPLPDPARQFAPLRRAHEQAGFRRLVVAGDLFEKTFVPELHAEFRALLEGLGVEWVGLVPGNHDRAAARHAALVPLWPDGVTLGDWRVMHGDGAPGVGKCVIGHWHPCVRVEGRKLPCYLVSEDCVVLPAFSRDAAGVDVRRQARWQAFRRIAIAGAARAGQPMKTARGTFRGPRVLLDARARLPVPNTPPVVAGRVAAKPPVAVLP